MSFHEVINAPRLAETVKKQLKQSIFDGTYTPGNRMPSESELVTSFGVSRVIVREAIRDLERSGFVDIKRGPKGGAYVKTMKHDALSELMRDILTMKQVPISDLLEVRLLVEPEVAALAAERATAEDINRIEKYFDEEPESGTEAYLKWNIRFHRLVVKSSHNYMYEILINILLDFAQELILQLNDQKIVLHDNSSHHQILDLIKNKDSEGARQLFSKHLEKIKPALKKLETNVI